MYRKPPPNAELGLVSVANVILPIGGYVGSSELEKTKFLVQNRWF